MSPAKYIIMVRFIFSVIWLLVMAGASWGIYDFHKKSYDADWVKKQYPSEMKQFQIHRGRVDSVISKFEVSNGNADQIFVYEIYEITAQSKNYPVANVKDYNTKKTVLAGDTVYLMSPYDGKSIVSKKAFTQEQIDEINALAIWYDKRHWLLILWQIILLIGVIGFGCSLFRN